MRKIWIVWLDDGTRTRRRWVVLLHAHVPMLRLVAIVAALSQAHGRRRSDRGRLPHPNPWFGDGAVSAFLGRKPPPAGRRRSSGVRRRRDAVGWGTVSLRQFSAKSQDPSAIMRG